MIPSGQSFSVFNSQEPARTAGTQSVRNNRVDHAAAPKDVTAPVEKKEEGGFLSFLKTILDIINPLQHIPVVSTIYRQVTGDEISPAARVVGDTLFGGPVGAALAVADITAEKTTGKDIGQNVMAMFDGGQKDSAPVQVASSDFRAADIIWNKTVSPSPLSPPSRMTAAADGSEPVRTLPPLHAPVQSQKKAPVLAAAPTLLPLQEAPVSRGRSPAVPEPMHSSHVPKEAIAARMMEALDKYGAMKREERTAATSNYGVF